MVPALVALATTAAAAQETSRPQQAGETVVRDQVNAWTVGFAGGLLEGAPIRFATEIARVVNDGGEMHVLPVVTRGPTENVNDLLYLRGIDVAIINGDSLDEYRAQVPQIGGRIVQPVSFGTACLRPPRDLLALRSRRQEGELQHPGDGGGLFRPVDLQPARGRGRQDLPAASGRDRDDAAREIAAVVFVTSKPIDAFAKGKWEPGFKFLPIEYGPKLADYYVPAALTSSDYPALVPSGGEVATIAVPTVLVSYNWKHEWFPISSFRHSAASRSRSTVGAIRLVRSATWMT